MIVLGGACGLRIGDWGTKVGISVLFSIRRMIHDWHESSETHIYLSCLNSLK